MFVGSPEKCQKYFSAPKSSSIIEHIQLQLTKHDQVFVTFASHPFGFLPVSLAIA